MTVLLQKAREGNRDARGQLMAQLQNYLAFVAHHQMDETLQAKMGPSDVVQQSMIQAVENLDKFQGNTVEEFRGWIRQILVNEAKQMRRNFHAHKRDVHRETQMNDSQAPGLRGMLADSLPTPETNACAEEQREAIRGALARLPELERLIIQWRNWEGLEFEEIAERLNISASTVSRKWYLALVSFKNLLEDGHE